MRRLLFVLSLLLVGSAMAQDPIVIGVNLELSGRMTVTGNDSLNGIRVAHIEQDSALGRPIQLSICDNASTPEGSVACANRFVDEGAVAVLGTYATSHSLPAANIFQDVGIVMVSTGSTNPATTQVGDYIFRIPYTDQFQGAVAAQWTTNNGYGDRVAIFRQQDDDYSVGLTGFFQDSLEAIGGETIVMDFTANTVDFSAQVNDLRAFNPTMIYYTGFCAEAASLIPQLRQQGIDVPILGGDASDDAQCPEGGGQVFDGFTFTSFGDPEVLSGEAAERATAFGELFASEYPDAAFTGFALAAADAYKVVVAAIEAAGSDEPTAIRDALQSMVGFPGVSGEITFAGTDGTPANRIMGLYAYQVQADGTWEKVVIEGIQLE